MVIDAIFTHAQRTPDKAAMIHNGQVVPYRRFAHLIGLVAARFAAQGLAGPGYAIVAIGHLMDFWIVSLALRRLGLTTMAARAAADVTGFGLSGVAAVVGVQDEAWGGLEAACHEIDVRLIWVGTPADSDAADPPARQHGGHILQTSGTTGVYKKVLIEASVEPAMTRRRCEVYGMTHACVTGVLDFGGSGLGYKSPIATWTVGGTAVIHQSQPRWQALLQPGLTHCHAIPQMLADILAAPDGAFPRSETMKMIVGGGPLSQALADETRRRITPHLYVNVGSTEVSTFAYTAIETPEDRRWHRPLTDIAVQVVDEEDKPLPSGRVGRVRVSTLAGPDQYLGDAEATAAFFKNGYFYPGDLGMIRDDGRLALHGRVTDVLNIKGNKIAPGPMEDALRERLGVREVVLFSQQNEAAEEEIHVTIETATPIEPKRLNAALSAEIQGFPSARVHFVRSMPRNVMGKVMRLALREQVLGTP